MNKKTKINLNLITKVYVNPPKLGVEGILYTWQEATKTSFFGFVGEDRDAGYYANSRWYESIHKIPNNCYDIGGELYTKSNVCILTVDKSETFIYFDSEEEANSYLNSNFTNLKPII